MIKKRSFNLDTGVGVRTNVMEGPKFYLLRGLLRPKSGRGHTQVQRGPDHLGGLNHFRVQYSPNVMYI